MTLQISKLLCIILLLSAYKVAPVLGQQQKYTIDVSHTAPVVSWEIGLKRFLMKPHDNFGLYFRPLFNNAPFKVDLPARVNNKLNINGQLLKINHITFVPEHKTSIQF